MSEKKEIIDFINDTSIRIIGPILVLLSIFMFLIFSDTPKSETAYSILLDMTVYLLLAFFFFVLSFIISTWYKFDWKPIIKRFKEGKGTFEETVPIFFFTASWAVLLWTIFLLVFRFWK